MMTTYCTVQAVLIIITAQRDAEYFSAADAFQTKADVPLQMNGKRRFQQVKACMANMLDLQSVRWNISTLGIQGIYDEAADGKEIISASD